MQDLRINEYYYLYTSTWQRELINQFVEHPILLQCTLNASCRRQRDLDYLVKTVANMQITFPQSICTYVGEMSLIYKKN